MRDGTRTVLSMQNDYEGPLADFAMVVPVPVVLHEKDVKTLPQGSVRPRRVARLAAARRVLGAGPVLHPPPSRRGAPSGGCGAGWPRVDGDGAQGQDDRSRSRRSSTSPSTRS